MKSRSLIIPNVTVFEFERADVGLVYDVSVYVPPEEIERPRKGWPLYVLLDGNATFLTTLEMMRLQSRNIGKTNIVPGILVGISEKTDNPFPAGRSYDMTTPAEEESMKEWFEKRNMPQFVSGGADAFTAFIMETVLPFIYETYSVNRKNKTITGHSLSGLFTLYLFAKHPQSFERYYVGSPSLWWNNEEIIGLLPKEKTGAVVQVFIGEKEPPNMKEKCERLVTQLAPITKQVHFSELAGENHMSSLPRVLVESIRQ